MQPNDRFLAAALLPGLPHGAFRLYVILAGAAWQADVEDEYFPVTLNGLLELHPGTAGRRPGATTVIKQIAALRWAGLLETRAAIHRTEPHKPVLVKVLDPATPLAGVASVANMQ